MYLSVKRWPLGIFTRFRASKIVRFVAIFIFMKEIFASEILSVSSEMKDQMKLFFSFLVALLCLGSTIYLLITWNDNDVTLGYKSLNEWEVEKKATTPLTRLV